MVFFIFDVGKGVGFPPTTKQIISIGITHVIGTLCTYNIPGQCGCRPTQCIAFTAFHAVIFVVVIKQNHELWCHDESEKLSLCLWKSNTDKQWQMINIYNEFSQTGNFPFEKETHSLWIPRFNRMLPKKMWLCHIVGYVLLDIGNKAVYLHDDDKTRSCCRQFPRLYDI